MSLARRLLIAGFTLFAAAGPLSAQRADLPIPTEFDTVHVALLIRTGGGPTDTAVVRRLIYDHMQYKLRLLADGISLASGPTSDGDDERLAGISLLRAASMADARRIAEGDPAVRAGRFRVQIMQWLVPRGRLSLAR